MSDSGGFNPFEDSDSVAEPTSSSHSSSPFRDSPSSPSSPLTTSSAFYSITPGKPSSDAKPNGYHPQHDDHDKPETLYEHLAHTDPAPAHTDTADSPTASPVYKPERDYEREQEETEDEPSETGDEYGNLVSSEPQLFLDFQLSALPDAYADILSSLSSLTTSLTTLQAQYTSQHAATLAASLAEQQHYQQQQTTIHHEITALQAQLDTLNHTQHTKQQHLNTLQLSVTHKKTHHTTLTTHLTSLAHQHAYLATKLRRRGQQSLPRLRLYTLRPAVAGGLRRIVVPGVAVDGVFGFLTVREVESAVRTCKRWRWVVGRNGVWKNGLRRIAGNKRKKEKEREETGEAVTRDEFDQWTERDQHEHEGVVEANEHDMDGHTPPASPSNKRKDDPAFHLTPAAAAALNLPPTDSPVPDHLHYALTVDLTRDLYTVTITSRRVHTLYQCAACMDSLTPGQPAAVLPKSSSVVICCTLVPKAASVTELQFCEQMMGMQEQMAVAKQDVQRLTRQVKEDGEVKRRLQAELSDREAELRKVQAELDFSMQQQMSDEMTRQFLDDSVNTTTEQLQEERNQTISLRNMLRDAYNKRNQEVTAMEEEAESMVAVVEGLKEEKGRLAREVKRLQVGLDGVTGERERAKREYERLMGLIEQLREL